MGGYVFSKTAQGLDWVWKEGKVQNGLGSSAKSRVTSQQQATSSSHNANSVNAQKSLNKKLSALEDAQQHAVKTEKFADGRIRYYETERPSTKFGPTRGSSYVTEYNPNTGQVRSWIENYKYD